MNPNNRFRKKVEKKEDFYIYDIEEHSKNRIQKEKYTDDLKKMPFENSEKYFLKRFVASVLDVLFGTIFLFVFCLIMSMITILGIFRGSTDDMMYLISWSWVFLLGSIFFTKIHFMFCLLITLSQIIFIALFHTSFESSGKQVALGKRIVGLIVINENGQRLRYDQSFKRNFLKYLLFPLLGFFFKEKRFFHNVWTQSVIIKKSDWYKMINI